jgi:hypothetical protein
MELKVDSVQGLSADLIGEIIAVQVIPRLNGDELNVEKMVKYVGKLEAFKLDRTIVTVKLEGLETIVETSNWQKIEFYHYKKNPKRRYPRDLRPESV